MGQEQTGATGRLVQMATRLYRAMERALQKISDSMRAVLATRVEDGDVRWVLALLLSGWRLSDAGEPGAAEIASILKETGAAPLVQQIASLQALLPESFSLFVESARVADTDPKLAGAAAYLGNAINELGEVQRNALHSWLRGAPFLEAGRALIRRFPVPGSGRPPSWGAPTAPTPSRSPRGDRFDRADYAAREQQAQVVELAPPAAPEPPAPVLDDEAVTRSYLFSLGWALADVDRLIAGPKRS